MSTELTIVITTHNRPEFLREAVQSVLNQDSPHWELIIVDDGSRVPAREFIAADPEGRIHHGRHPDAKGVSAARNLGTAMARTPLVAFLDDDDWLEPAFVHRITHHFHTLGDDIHFAWPILCHFRGRKPLRQSQQRPARIRQGQGRASAYRALQGVKATGSVFRRQALLEAGGFDESLPVSEDRDLMFRMLTRGYGCAQIPEPLVAFRIHGEERLSAAGGERQIRTDQLLAQRHREFLSRHSTLGGQFLNMLARRQFQQGDVPGALATSRQSFALNPYNPRTWRRLVQWFVVLKTHRKGIRPH